MNPTEEKFNNPLLRQYVERLNSKYDWETHSLYRETLNKIGWEIEISVCRDKGVAVGDLIEEKQFYYDTEDEMEADFQNLDSIADFD